MRNSITTQVIAGLLIALATVVLADEPRSSGVPISFTLTKPGNVSAAIYDAHGRMVRELVRAEPMQSGKHSLAWDALDKDGKPAPAGKYEWRSLLTQGLRSEYLMNVGTSVGERWWPGNHAGPRSGVVADDSPIIAANPEGPPLMTRVRFDGRVVWERGQYEPARDPYDVAVGGGKAFYLQDNGKVFELHMYDGANHAFNNDTNEARYDKAAAELAWSRTVDFLRKNLS